MTLPLPRPELLGDLPAEVHLLSPHTPVWRIYRAGGPFPSAWNGFRYFGPLPSRFDHHLSSPRGEPEEQNRGVLYAATGLVTTVAEVFQAGRHVDRFSGSPRVTLFHVAEPLPLVDLTGSFATRIGCHQGIHSSPERSKTRAWARAMYRAWPEEKGLLYRSKMGLGEPAMVLWERARLALNEQPLLDRPLDAPELLASLRSAAADLGYSIE